jgi:hypothetical protein
MRCCAMLLAIFSGTVMDPRHLSASNARLPVIDETALPFRAGLFLPQIVHCPLPVAGLHSRYGTSGGCQSWSYRLYCLPGARGGLEQLPHCALSPESGDRQRATAGENNYALPGSVSLESRLLLRDVTCYQLKPFNRSPRRIRHFSQYRPDG